MRSLEETFKNLIKLLKKNFYRPSKELCSKVVEIWHIFYDILQNVED